MAPFCATRRASRIVTAAEPSLVNPAVNGGGLLESGNPQLLVNEVIAVGATWIFGGTMTFAILEVVDLVFKVRVGQDAEITGLDLAVHREAAYTA